MLNYTEGYSSTVIIHELSKCVVIGSIEDRYIRRLLLVLYRRLQYIHRFQNLSFFLSDKRYFFLGFRHKNIHEYAIKMISD